MLLDRNGGQLRRRPSDGLADSTSELVLAGNAALRNYIEIDGPEAESIRKQRGHLPTSARDLDTFDGVVAFRFPKQMLKVTPRKRLEIVLFREDRIGEELRFTDQLGQRRIERKTRIGGIGFGGGARRQ